MEDQLPLEGTPCQVRERVPPKNSTAIVDLQTSTFWISLLFPCEKSQTLFGWGISSAPKKHRPQSSPREAPRLAEAAPASPPLAPEPLDARLAGLDRLRSLRLSPGPRASRWSLGRILRIFGSCCGLVVEIQILSTAKMKRFLLPFQRQPRLWVQPGCGSASSKTWAQKFDPSILLGRTRARLYMRI